VLGNFCIDTDTFQISAFREFLAFFVQPDVYEADLLPNPYSVPLRLEDLLHWKEKGVQPLYEQQYDVCPVQATERAHRRIVDNFCSVLATLNYSYQKNQTYETWVAYLRWKKYVVMPIPPDFCKGAMALLARHRSNIETSHEESFPQLRKSLEEWGLYQPYHRPVLLMPALMDYMSLFGKALPDLMSENDEVISTIASHFESFIVCLFPRPCLQILKLTEIEF
jgi:hypothetical protein